MVEIEMRRKGLRLFYVSSSEQYRHLDYKIKIKIEPIREQSVHIRFPLLSLSLAYSQSTIEKAVK